MKTWQAIHPQFVTYPHIKVRFNDERRHEEYYFQTFLLDLKLLGSLKRDNTPATKI